MGTEKELLIACALRKELKALRKRLQLKCQFLVTGVGSRKTATRLAFATMPFHGNVWMIEDF